MNPVLTFKDYRVRSPILRCPTCKGRYIKTREGQKDCLFCVRGRERREEEQARQDNRFYLDTWQEIYQDKTGRREGARKV